MPLIDTHCHLDQPPLCEAVADVLARAAAREVRQCVSIGTTVETSRANVELARQFPGRVVAAVGIHPHEADAVTDAMLEAIDALTTAPGVVAIGEVGLDQYRDHATLANQERVFRRFLRMATDRHLPILIHCRDAYDPLLALIRETGCASWRGIIHCASGPPAFINAALALGFYVSFAGNITFPKADALRVLVPLVPDDRLLVETDAPWLAPQPVRGQKNEPAFITHTAALLAQLRGTTAERISELTSRNARALFQLPEVAWS